MVLWSESESILENLGNCLWTGIKNKKRQAKIGITDIIESCERIENNNSDSNLINKIYNSRITEIIESNLINTILFTGKGVNKEFCEHFVVPKNIDLIVLPSPSPIYRRMSLEEKVENYKKHLPRL